MKRSLLSGGLVVLAAALAVVAWWLAPHQTARPVPAARPELGRAQALLDFDGLELPADAVLQPREAPEAEALDGLKPVEARPGRLALPTPGPLVAKADVSAAPASRAAAEPSPAATVIRVSPAEGPAVAASPPPRPPVLAGEPGRPAAGPPQPSIAGNEPVPAPHSDAIAPENIEPPEGFGLWSQSPPPAGSEGDR